MLELPRKVSRRGLLKVGAATGVLGAVGLTSAGLATASSDTSTSSVPAAAIKGKVREYWIQVDSYRHNLVPTGYDQMMGMKFTPDQSTMWALGFRAYSPNWQHVLPGNDDIGPNTGIPGPNLRAEVGDTVLVHFRNNDTHYKQPHSMHPHGFIYAPDSTGSYRASRPNFPGTAIKPGESYTYTWRAVADSVGTWPYHDHSVQFGLTSAGPVMEMSAELGMFGLIAITDSSTPKVDREFFLFFHDLYQADVPELGQDFDSFNGLSYLGNTPRFVAKVGERVRWRVAALGREFHVFHIHGHRWISEATGRPADSEILGPSSTLTIDYVEDNAGDWLYHCHVTDHMAGGMVGDYLVEA